MIFHKYRYNYKIGELLCQQVNMTFLQNKELPTL